MLHQGKAPSPCMSPVSVRPLSARRPRPRKSGAAGGGGRATYRDAAPVGCHRGAPRPGDTRRAEPPRPGFRGVVPHDRSWRRDGRLKRSRGAQPGLLSAPAGLVARRRPTAPDGNSTLQKVSCRRGHGATAASTSTGVWGFPFISLYI